MIRSIRFVSLSLLLVTLAAATACGGGGGDDLDPGFTACGDFPDQEPKSCQPGQYCADEIFSECSNGCLSSINCLPEQSCQKAPGQDVGVCSGDAAPDAGPQQSDQLERCLDACTRLIECGLVTGAEGADCNRDCQSASDAERRAVADCVLPWECETPLPGCIAAECGPSYPCPGDQECLGHMCL